MLTLSNVLPCQLNPSSNAAISSLHDHQMRLNFSELCGSQVSLTGRCPVGYYGHFNQAFPNYERGCTFPPAAFPGNAGASSVCCNPAVPQGNQVIHIYPTFVNLTSVQEKRPHFGPSLCPLKLRGQLPPTTELTRQGRLPPISMFSSALHRHNLCSDIKSDYCAEDNHGTVSYNEMNVCKTKLKPSLAHKTPNLDKFRYSVEVVNTRKKKQVFKSTKVVQGHRTVKKTVTSSVHYCKRLQGLVSADIPHSIASILDAPTRGILDVGDGSVHSSNPPQETLERACFPECSGGSDASLDVSDDDKNDVDVTSCSGDENAEEGEDGSSPSECAQCPSAQKDEARKRAVISKQTDTGFIPPIQYHPSEAFERSLSANCQSGNSHSVNSQANGIRVNESHIPIKTYNEPFASNLEQVRPATLEDQSQNNFNVKNVNDNNFQYTELSHFPGSSNAPLNPFTKSLPPIESLRHTDAKKTESVGRSAFTPIAKALAFPDTILCSPKHGTRVRGREVKQLFLMDACGDKIDYEKFKLIQHMHESNEAPRQKAKENRNAHAMSIRQISESMEADAVNLLRNQSFLYRNPHNEGLAEGTLPNTTGSWFQWLQQRNVQPVGPRTETPPVARCPPPPPPRYYCDACKKTYSTFGGLSKHRQFHCSEHVRKEFACNVCSKSYSSLGALKMHIRTHTLPCKCHVCGKAFSRPWLLQGHVRTHTGEKPFRCNHCGRAFADRSNLRAHLQTHAEVKKYACRKCGKTFSRMSLLTKHTEGSCPGNTKTLVQ